MDTFRRPAQIDESFKGFIGADEKCVVFVGADEKCVIFIGFGLTSVSL
jgi:hypothetical protein